MKWWGLTNNIINGYILPCLMMWQFNIYYTTVDVSIDIV